MLITCPKCSVQYKIPEGVYVPAGKKMKCSNCQHVFTLNENVEEQNKVEEVLDSPQQIDIDPVVEEEGAPEAVFAEDEVFKAEEVPQPFVPVTPAVTEEKKSVGVWAALISMLILIVLIGAGVLYKDVLFGQWLNIAPALAPQNKIQRPNENVDSKPVAPVAEKVNTVRAYTEETPQIVLLPQIQSVRFEQRQDVDLEIRIEGVLKNQTNQPMRLPEKVRAIAYDAQGKVMFEKEIYLTDKVLSAGDELSFFGTYQPAPEGVQWVDVTF